jgi:hypothetical protein
LAAEAAELTTFLDKVTRGNEVRKGLQKDVLHITENKELV